MNEELTVHVPLRLEGEAKAVVDEGGIVDPSVDTIEVSCTPANIPNEFVIDITDMQPHDVIRLADVPMPKGVTGAGRPGHAGRHDDDHGCCRRRSCRGRARRGSPGRRSRVTSAST